MPQPLGAIFFFFLAVLLSPWTPWAQAEQRRSVRAAATEAASAAPPPLLQPPSPEAEVAAAASAAVPSEATMSAAALRFKEARELRGEEQTQGARVDLSRGKAKDSGAEEVAPLFDFDVLVTGYEPFLEHAVNPAHDVAASLNGSCDTVHLASSNTVQICYEGVPLPVTPEGSGWTAQAVRESPARWDGIIHLGFESSAKGLRLETIAANVQGSEDYGYMWNADIPCEKEGTPFRYIHEGSPCVLPTTAPVSYLDLQDLAELLEDSGHGDLVSLETWSRDAGAYYCNEQFYRTLHAIRESAAAVEGSSFIPAIFVHLPDAEVVAQDHMALMVRFIAESIMMGTVGLIPDSCEL